MAHEANSHRCPACGAAMVYEERPDTVEYRGRKREVPTLGWWCTSCEEATFTGEALVNNERVFQSFKAEVDGVLKPAEVTTIRERLHLSQRAAGERLGGGARAFQKYESGKTAVSVPMSNLLRLLANDPKRLEELPMTNSDDGAE